MIRLLVTIIIALLVITGDAQTIHKDYWDGKVYFKLKQEVSNLPVSLEDLRINHKGLAVLCKRVRAEKLSRPFEAFKTPVFDRIYRLDFGDFQKIEELIGEFQKLAIVEYAEKVPIDRIVEMPDDPNQGGQYALDLTDAYDAFDLHKGGGAVVAIVDDAVEINHEDLQANIWINSGEIPENSIDDDGNGYIDDINGWDTGTNDNDPNPDILNQDHGTHVAGIAGAVTNNGKGIASVGYYNKIMPVKTTGNAGFIVGAYEGITYAAVSGADVINCSWGGGNFSQTNQSICTAAHNLGAIIVAAAGNDGNNNLFYPAAYNNVFAVANTDANDVKNGTSSYGTWVDISAPGTSIFSTEINGGYGYKSGTSMASPMVAGLCGLIKSVNPSTSIEDVLDCIKFTAENIYTYNPSYLGELGDGRINVNDALICALPNIAPVVVTTVSEDVICTGSSTQHIDLSYGTETWFWSFPGGTPSSSTDPNPIIYYDTPGIYDVTLTASNSFGSTTETFTNVVSVTNDIRSDLYFEDFEDGNISNWIIDSNGGVNWSAKAIGTGSDRLGDYALGINNYSENFYGARDYIISPSIDLNGYSSAILSFDHAYRQNFGGEADSLIITISTDGGITFPYDVIRDAENGSYNISTFISLNGEFFGNQEADWCGNVSPLGASCLSFDISYLIPASIVVKIENYSRQGNNLFIDNFKVNVDCPLFSSVENTSFSLDGNISLFPNPNSGRFTLQFDNWNEDTPRVQMYDILGRNVMDREYQVFGSATEQVNVDGLSAGTYFVRISVGNRSVYKKMIVQ